MDWKMQNDIWYAQNAQDTTIHTTASGLQYRIIADPNKSDVTPNLVSYVYCDYEVKLINGYVVDRGNNAKLPLSGCIPGFREGCRLIHNNGDIELFIPYYLGYDAEEVLSQKEGKDKDTPSGQGTEGTSGYIPPYSVLIYTIHLCSVSN